MHSRNALDRAAHHEFRSRTDSNKRCVFGEQAVAPSLADFLGSRGGPAAEGAVGVAPGKFVAVHVRGSGETSLKATALAATTLEEFSALDSRLRERVVRGEGLS
jgi:hypothetical protein